jgi:hypothetical protein
MSASASAATVITGRKFCTNHQGEVAAGAGSYVLRRNSKRWICFRCQEIIEIIRCRG